MNIRIAIVDDQAQTRELLRQDLLVPRSGRREHRLF